MVENPEIDIRKLREQLDWSQQELAVELSVNTATISRWESGKSKPSRVARRRLRELLRRLEEKRSRELVAV